MMRVILNRDFILRLSNPAPGVDEFSWPFYKTGDILSAGNRVIDDLLPDSTGRGAMTWHECRVKYVLLSGFELECLESADSGIFTWIIPEINRPLLTGPFTAGSPEKTVSCLSKNSKIIMDGSVCGNIDIICEFNSMRAGSFSAAVPEKTDTDSRTMLWLGSGNFEKITSTSICCIGAGGVMNPFIVQAVHHGFRKFIIIDSDRLKAHNLNRFIGAAPSDAGRFKTDILKGYILRLRPDAEVSAVNSMFPEDGSVQAMAGSDLIVAGVDNNYTRVLVQLYALALNRAFFDMGSGIFLEDINAEVPVVDERGGQVRFSSPGGPCLACMGVDPSAAKSPGREILERLRGYIAGTDLTPPSVVTLNFAVSSLCLNMAVEYITTGKLENNHVHYDESGRRLLNIREKRNTQCSICGEFNNMMTYQ